MNVVKHRDGHFCTLYTPLREDTTKCFSYYRMKATTFDELVSRVQNHLKKSDTNMRAAVTPEEMLAISTAPEEHVISQDRASQIPHLTDVKCTPVWLSPFKSTQSCDVSQQDSTCVLA
jgi:hypothetical protein